MLIEMVAILTVLWIGILYRYLRPARTVMRNRVEYNQSYWN